MSSGARYQSVYGSMRELARREPTFALHVHIGVDSPEHGIVLHDRLRAHLPLLLALSANSPFWQGRDTGLASARTPLFQAFPRVGIPRGFHSYADYVEAVDLLMRTGALAEPTSLWWDVRPQPRFGTVEVRVMDVQTRVPETAAIVALVQCIARRELIERVAARPVAHSPEVLVENRFLAARDGMDAFLIDPEQECAVPARILLDELVLACEPHAEALGCPDELAAVADLALRTGAQRQIELARGEGLPRVVAGLADAFVSDGTVGERRLAVSLGRSDPRLRLTPDLPADHTTPLWATPRPSLARASDAHRTCHVGIVDRTPLPGRISRRPPRRSDRPRRPRTCRRRSGCA